MIIPTQNNIKTITDMRENALGLLEGVRKKDEPTIIFNRANPMAVLLSVKRYNRLMDLLEDYLDGELARELEQQPKKKSDYIPLGKITKKLKIKL